MRSRRELRSNLQIAGLLLALVAVVAYAGYDAIQGGLEANRMVAERDLSAATETQSDSGPADPVNHHQHTYLGPVADLYVTGGKDTRIWTESTSEEKRTLGMFQESTQNGGTSRYLVTGGWPGLCNEATFILEDIHDWGHRQDKASLTIRYEWNDGHTKKLMGIIEKECLLDRDAGRFEVRIYVVPYPVRGQKQIWINEEPPWWVLQEKDPFGPIAPEKDEQEEAVPAYLT